MQDILPNTHNLRYTYTHLYIYIHYIENAGYLAYHTHFFYIYIHIYMYISDLLLTHTLTLHPVSLPTAKGSRSSRVCYKADKHHYADQNRGSKCCPFSSHFIHL